MLRRDLPAGVNPGTLVLSLPDLNLYSRNVVSFEVHDTDTAEHAAHLAPRTVLAEELHALPSRPVLLGDNGASLETTTVLTMLHWLGIKPSYSRPRVSDDNAFAKALFRMVKLACRCGSAGMCQRPSSHWVRRSGRNRDDYL